jgi:hypothetical protein
MFDCGAKKLKSKKRKKSKQSQIKPNTNIFVIDKNNNKDFGHLVFGC